MIKLTGALLVLFAGTAFGFFQAAKYVQRSKQLRILIHALQRLETEINYGQTPLPDAFNRTSQMTEQPIAILFEQTAKLLENEEELALHEAWLQAVEYCWGYTALKSREKEVLLRMGTVLGMSDSDDQRKHLQLAQLQLKSEEEGAREEQQKYEGMWKSLGALGAVLIVILMV